MGNFTTAFMIVMCLNLLMMLTQASILAIGSGDPTAQGSIYFNCKGTLLGSYTSDCTKLANSQNPITNMPQQSSIPSSSGGAFSDITSVILGWFASIPGLNYVLSIGLAFSTILNAMNLPTAFIVIVSGAWYGLTIWLSIAFAVWRD